MPKTACSKPALPLLLIATLSLTACATAPSRPSVVCPPVASYDPAFRRRLADEIKRLPPDAALERAMLDYARLRDQARACTAALLLQPLRMTHRQHHRREDRSKLLQKASAYCAQAELDRRLKP